MLGVIKDLENEKYHSSEGISRSGIMEFRKSPSHYWNAYLNPDRPAKEQTEAMIFGSAFHTFLLEPDKFETQYFINNEAEPEVDDKPLKKDLQAEYGKEIGAEMYEEAKLKEFNQKQLRDAFRESVRIKSEGKIILKPEQYDTLRLMKESVYRHKQARELIHSALIEQSIFWRDPHTDVLCKTRPDIWHSNMTVDLKTIADASERSFTSAMVSNGYHIQSAMNYEGILNATGKMIKNHAFLCVEKTFPFAVAIYILDETALEHARYILKNELLNFKFCLEKNEWPSYETKTISLPKWAEQIY